MALLCLDGFDQYGTTVSLITSYYWVSALLTFYTLVAGRFGAKALQIVTGATTRAYAPLNNTATLIVGFALQLVNSSLTGNATILEFSDGASIQCSIGVDVNLHLTFWRGAVGTGTLLYTSNNVFTSSIWNQVEAKVTIDNAAGAIEIRINGTAVDWVPAASGINTRGGTTNNYANRVGFFSQLGVGTLNIIVDDFYILDTSGSRMNDFIGGARIQTNFPTGAGSSSQYTPNGESAPNFNCVDNNPPNDSTFVSDSNAGDRDLYTYPALAGSTVLATAIIYRCEKDDAGARGIKPIVKSGGTVYNGSAVGLALSFLWQPQLWQEDPNTGLQWTQSNLNAAEFGQETTN